MWEKREIDRSDMLHLLCIIYGKTAAGFERISLFRIIMERGRPSVKAKVNALMAALKSSGVIIAKGYGAGKQYRWNREQFGVVSLPIAEMVIKETEEQTRVRARRQYHLNAICRKDNI